MAETWKVINQDTDLFPGDVIQIDYDIIGWTTTLEAVQIAAIEKRINDDPRFEIDSHTQVINNRITFTIRVKETPPAIYKASVIVAVVAAALVVISVFVWLSIREMRLKDQAAYAYSIETGQPVPIESIGQTVTAAGEKIGNIILVAIVGFVVVIWLKSR